VSELLEPQVEGNRWIITAEFRVPPGTGGALTNPTTVTFTARRRREIGDVASAYTPTAYVMGTAAEVTNPSTGVFLLTFTPGQGTWAVHVQGTGAAHAASEVAFVVDRAEALA
jgi:hypothetical protein